MINENNWLRKAARNSRALALITLCAVGILIYSNSLNGEFCFDDHAFILNSAAVQRGPRDVPALWREFHVRLVVGMSYALNYWLGGRNAVGYHILNLLVHVLASVAVFYLILFSYATPVLRETRHSAIGQRIAFWAAMVFLCHPVQTQAVSYITQRASSIVTLFYLLVLIFYVKYRLNHRGVFLAGFIGAAALGLLSKQSMLTAPAVIAVYDLLFFGGAKIRGGHAVKALGLSLAVSLLLLWAVRLEPAGSAYQYQGLVSWERFDARYLWTEINVLRTYLRLLALPVAQNFDYDYPVAGGFLEPATFFSFLLLLMLAVVAFRSRRGAREVSFCIFWFFATTAVEALSVVFGNRGVIYEHWLYMPMAGFSWFLSYIAFRAVKSPVHYQRIMMSVVLLFGALTFRRNMVWEKELYLWQDVLKKAPSNPGAYFAFGELCQRQGRTPVAEEYYRKAVALYYARKQPFDATTKVLLSRIYNNLGLLSRERDNPEAAVVFFQKAIRVNPNHAGPYQNLAILFYEYGQYRETIALLERANRIQGLTDYACFYLGLSYQALGDGEKAGEYFREALRLFSDAGDRAKVEAIRAYLGPG
ncbi:MAG TPA: tetratricopeptide repeat protein [Candidatus Omnitrophota bacterium]|nr:tetratricopeptide repeat protein [Candidatus Omnitrophota bacterium]